MLRQICATHLTQRQTAETHRDTSHGSQRPNVSSSCDSYLTGGHSATHPNRSQASACTGWQGSRTKRRNIRVSERARGCSCDPGFVFVLLVAPSGHPSVACRAAHANSPSKWRPSSRARVRHTRPSFEAGRAHRPRGEWSRSCANFRSCDSSDTMAMRNKVHHANS